MSKQHYHASTYKAQNSIGYLIKRAHSMMMDVLEQLFAERGFSFIQYVILSWLRDGIAVNPKDICLQYRHDSGALTRVIDQLDGAGTVGARAPRSRSAQGGAAAHRGRPQDRREPHSPGRGQAQSRPRRFLARGSVRNSCACWSSSIPGCNRRSIPATSAPAARKRETAMRSQGSGFSSAPPSSQDA